VPPKKKKKKKGRKYTEKDEKKSFGGNGVSSATLRLTAHLTAPPTDSSTDRAP
jgi:hypothetical protein